MEVVGLQVDLRQFVIGDHDTRRIGLRVHLTADFEPVLVVVAAIRFTITSWLMSGLPRQFWLM